MKNLLTQLRNEWRRNVFLALELLVVSCLLWYLVDWTYVTVRTYTLPMGFDTEHCYQVLLGTLDPKSPDYRPDATVEDNMKSLEEIVDRLRHREGVEYAALSQNSIPYNSGSNVDVLIVDSVPVRGKRIWAQPDFFRLFRFQGVALAEENGPIRWTTNIDSVATAVNRSLRHTLISRNFTTNPSVRDKLSVGDATSLLGHSYTYGQTGNDAQLFVGGVAEPIRSDHFTSPNDCGGYYLAMELTHDDLVLLENPRYLELSIRLTPEADTGQQFTDELMADADRLYQVGNVFLLDVVPFSEWRRVAELDSMNEAKTQAIIMGFLLLNIFLGVVGTFWFRTQHRRSEIALRMAFGSTRAAVFGRLIAEGLLLLTLMMVPAMFIAFHIGYAELVDVFKASRFFLCVGATWLLMALMIVASIGYPARRAMRIQPAEALHDE